MNKMKNIKGIHQLHFEGIERPKECARGETDSEENKNRWKKEASRKENIKRNLPSSFKPVCVPASLIRAALQHIIHIFFIHTCLH